MADNLLRMLQGESYFLNFVGNYIGATPTDLGELLQCHINVDNARLGFAHTEYVQNVEKFSLYLQSGDPDHFKRAGALLHSLYTSKPIIQVIFEPELDDVDTLATPIGMTYGDAEGELSFGNFFQEFHNEFTALSLSYDACRSYEERPRDMDFEYIHTACSYLRNNGNLSVESMFMLFKSLMQ